MSVLTIRQTVPLGPDAHGRDRGRLADDAAASVFRIDAQLERPLDINSAWRSPATQQAMYLAWRAYVEGRGPKPDHGRAIPADQSVHCRGYAIDTDDSRYVALLGDHGWFRTAADEAWHFEYDRTRDNHRNAPTPPPNPESEEDDDMPKNSGFYYTRAKDKAVVCMVVNTGSGFISEHTNGKTTNGDYNNPIAAAYDTGSWAPISESHANAIKASLRAVQRVEISIPDPVLVQDAV